MARKQPDGEMVTVAGRRIFRAKPGTVPPAELDADVIEVAGNRKVTVIPAGWRAGRINAAGCSSLSAIELTHACYELSLTGTAIELLPAGIRVESRLDLTGCTKLRSLPDDLKVGTLILRNCKALTGLPRGLKVNFLDLRGCDGLRSLPDDLRVQHGRLDLRDCIRIHKIPPGVGPLAQLDLAGCANITELPAGLEVNSWIDIAGSGINKEEQLPPGCRSCDLRWRGVAIDARIAFHPDTITGHEVLSESNAERRRVMMERIGNERFMSEVDAKVLDEDRDAGGRRRLLRVAIEGDEDLVCVEVNCPSTARQYVIRVPPKTRTCREAIAWTAGFDNPDDYKPVVET